MKLTVIGAPRTKKNSQRIMRTRSGGSFIAQSVQHNAWAESAILQMRGQAMCQRPRSAGPMEIAVNLSALVYRDRAAGDLGNFLAAICDALERAGVVANDRLIGGFDGSRLMLDAKNPRVELELTPLED